MTVFSVWTKAVQRSVQPELRASDVLANTFVLVADTLHIERRMIDHKVQARIVGTEEYPFVFTGGGATTQVVYGIGDWSLLERGMLSIVGPRAPSGYAVRVVEDLFQHILPEQLVVVSGGAPGIDQLAHRLALQKNIPTIVVLGCGLKQAWQSSLRSLLEAVVLAGGLILSAWKLLQAPTNYTFPQRNKLIAALCSVLFVPAAGQKSGSLITVDFAYKMHKHIYTVPANIYEPESFGTNALLVERKVQAVCSFPEMLAKHFPVLGTASSPLGQQAAVEQLAPEIQAICTLLTNKKQITFDQLIALSGQTPASLFDTIQVLEAHGILVAERPDERIIFLS